ncbi:MAG: hypothetical protein GY783_17870 [Gammaproteobacteria bacterium]|nr:hypothetical protein [Gammaproteobacteria bacterium]
MQPGDYDDQLTAEFITYLKESFDPLYAEGETRPKMMAVGLHARLIGRPGCIGNLHQFLDCVLWQVRVGFVTETIWRTTGRNPTRATGTDKEYDHNSSYRAI